MKRYVDSSGIGRWLLAMALLAACAPYPHPDEPLHPYDATIGTITKIVGSGEVQINGRIVGEGAVMRSGEHIETVADARATLALTRGGEVFFDAATDPDLEWLSEAFCKLRIIINVGSILVHTECQTEVETGTGAVVSSLRTMFHLTVNQQWTELTVLKGRVAISGRAGARQIVAAGQQCLVPRGGIAQPPRPVKVRPVIDWACQLDKRLCRYERPQPAPVTVPPLTGIHVDRAKAILENAGLKHGRTYQEPAPSRLQIGLVFRQRPEAGAKIDPGGAVDLWVYGAVRLPLRLPTLPQRLPRQPDFRPLPTNE